MVFSSAVVRRISENSSFVPSSSIFWLGTILCIVQILDGVLTGLGMHYFGTHMEGNPILRNLFETIGFIPALIIVKLSAILIVIALCISAKKLQWIEKALKMVTVFYVTAALIPWTYILVARIGLYL